MLPDNYLNNKLINGHNTPCPLLLKLAHFYIPNFNSFLYPNFHESNHCTIYSYNNLIDGMLRECNTTNSLTFYSK